MKSHYTSIICENPTDRYAQLEYAKREAEKVLADLRVFYTGDFGIKVYPVLHPFGWSVAADLTVNGEVFRHFDPADLCFLELNELCLASFLKLRETPSK